MSMLWLGIGPDGCIPGVMVKGGCWDMVILTVLVSLRRWSSLIRPSLRLSRFVVVACILWRLLLMGGVMPGVGLMEDSWDCLIGICRSFKAKFGSWFCGSLVEWKVILLASELSRLLVAKLIHLPSLLMEMSLDGVFQIMVSLVLASRRTISSPEPAMRDAKSRNRRGLIVSGILTLKGCQVAILSPCSLQTRENSSVVE
mmetsp:Transcript_41117/g.47400  ORF Transcript_41117/g.47400 Transcript_41117/m.47400 type:complete len:200 (-) Transcript_41117:3765-4364(-)